MKEKRSATTPIRNVEPMVPRPAPVPGHARDRRHRPALEEVGRAGRGPSWTSPRTRTSRPRSRPRGRGKVERKAAGTRARTPSPPPTISAAPRAAHAQPRRMSAAREAAAEEVAEVGGQEGHPEAGRGLLEREALGREVDREPVGDHEPDRIGEAAARRSTPQVWRQAEQLAPARRRRRPPRARLRAAPPRGRRGSSRRSASLDARVRLRRVVADAARPRARGSRGSP